MNLLSHYEVAIKVFCKSLTLRWVRYSRDSLLSGIASEKNLMRKIFWWCVCRKEEFINKVALSPPVVSGWKIGNVVTLAANINNFSRDSVTTYDIFFSRLSGSFRATIQEINRTRSRWWRCFLFFISEIKKKFPIRKDLSGVKCMQTTVKINFLTPLISLFDLLWYSALNIFMIGSTLRAIFIRSTSVLI